MNEKTRNFVKVFSNCFLIGKKWKYWINFFGIEYDKLKPTFLFDEQKKIAEFLHNFLNNRLRYIELMREKGM